MTQTPADPFLWLEDVEGERALNWVRERNAHAEAALASDSAFAQTKAGILEVLDSADKIPHVGKAGEHFYNVWTDAEHERGQPQVRRDGPGPRVVAAAQHDDRDHAQRDQPEE